MSLLETYNIALVAAPATLALLLVGLVIKERASAVKQSGPSDKMAHAGAINR